MAFRRGVWSPRSKGEARLSLFFEFCQDKYSFLEDGL
jgi:hypothetical protein